MPVALIFMLQAICLCFIYLFITQYSTVYLCIVFGIFDLGGPFGWGYFCRSFILSCQLYSEFGNKLLPCSPKICCLVFLQINLKHTIGKKFYMYLQFRLIVVLQFIDLCCTTLHYVWRDLSYNVVFNIAIAVLLATIVFEKILFTHPPTLYIYRKIFPKIFSCMLYNVILIVFYC